MNKIAIFIILLEFSNIILPIPNWDLSSQANIIDLAEPCYYILYEKKSNGLKVILKKKMEKSGDNIVSQNIVYVYEKANDNDEDYSKYIGERNVDFDEIDSQYKNKLGCGILICPKGRFHPYDFYDSKHINSPNSGSFSDNDDWDLRCYDHYTGYFYLFYLLKNGKNFFYKYNGGYVLKNNYVYSYFYDYMLENGNSEQNEYKFCILRYDGANNGVIRLLAKALKHNFGNGEVELVSNGGEIDINKSKNKTQAYFNNDRYLFYFTYNSVYDFESGYSTTSINFNSKEQYASSVSNIQIVKKTESPLTFVDNVEIQEMNFITGTKYAYYKIKNIDKDVTYYGLLDVTESKILYNVQAEFTTFIPASTSSTVIMLGITQNTVYQFCIIKTDCQNQCTDSNAKFILDPSGNKCQAEYDTGKVKLMPEGYYINKELCDLNFYEFNSAETECGLCKYINKDNNKLYKYINTRGCISISGSLPENAEYYNENDKLLKCKEHHEYNSDEDKCIPVSCFERCQTCYGYSENVNEQKCSSCKEGFNFDEESNNCNIPETPEVKPPTTIIEPPITVIIPPTTVIIPPSTIIIPPTTVITPPTTLINCRNSKCLICNEESDRLGLCLSCDETKYKKVNYTNTFSHFINCMEEQKLINDYYYDSFSEQYKPCYKLCNKCFGPGNVSYHNCIECKEQYMLRPADNPNNNCVVYSDFYYISAYNEYKPLNSPQCPEQAKYTIKNEQNKISCIYDCKADKTYRYLYNGNCLKGCPSGTIEDNFICKETAPEKIYISEKEIHLSPNKTIEDIGILAQSYAEEFGTSNNHISLYKDKNYNLLLYTNPSILAKSNLPSTEIDFGECYEEVKKAYNITENLIIAVGDNTDKTKTSTFYLFYHPISGKKLDTSNLCQNKSIIMKENLLSILDEKSENYDLQTSLTKQGINIFDINDPYYIDICYDFENPKNRDMALKDRIKETYVNVTLCNDGCINKGIDVKNNVASCDCKFNDITNSEIIHENAALEYLVGEFFEIVNSSNIMVLKCYKNLLKYFKRLIGGIIIVSLLSLCLIFTVIFFSYDINKMKRYIFSLTEKYTSFLANYSNIFKLFPPKRKSLQNKPSNNKLINYSNETSLKNDINKKYHKSKKQNTVRTANQNSLTKQQNSKDLILFSKKRNTKLVTIKEKHEEESNPHLEEGKKIKKYFKEYLSTSPDEMEYDDAIKRDKREFCEYFWDCLKEKQSLAYTFISSDRINTRTIKLILFALNITLYFVVCGLFFSESFISELYNTDDEKETFFSFIPRNIDKVIYTTIVSIFIGYLTGFFFLDEKKLKGIFKREKENRVLLKRSIVLLINEIQKRYLSFIIMTFVILLSSLYYILCFNYVYPKTQIEWVKSTILIIIIMQLLSVLKCLFETIFRFLSFKCESEKIFKFSKIFENN